MWRRPVLPLRASCCSRCIISGPASMQRRDVIKYARVSVCLQYTDDRGSRLPSAICSSHKAAWRRWDSVRASGSSGEYWYQTRLVKLLGRIACTECKDATCCYGCSVVCLCVCLLDTTVSPTKKAEPIKMPFGLWTRVCPSNHG